MANGKPGRPKGLPKTGGRKRGSGDKVTRELREIAQEYTPEAMEKIVAIMRGGENHTVQLAAAKEIFDRGHGKAVQFSEAKIEHRTVARIPMPAETAKEWAEQHAPEPAVH